MYKIVENHASKKQIFINLQENFKDHVRDMLRFIDSQYSNIIDTVPGIHHFKNEELIDDIADLVLNKESISLDDFYLKYDGFLSFPTTTKWYEMGGKAYSSSDLIKFDDLCSALEDSLRRNLMLLARMLEVSHNQRKECNHGFHRKTNRSILQQNNSIEAYLNLDIKDFPDQNLEITM